MPDLIQPTRRGFLRALGFVAAAPAIIKVSALMPVQAMPISSGLLLQAEGEAVNAWGGVWCRAYGGVRDRLDGVFTTKGMTQIEVRALPVVDPNDWVLVTGSTGR